MKICKVNYLYAEDMEEAESAVRKEEREAESREETCDYESMRTHIFAKLVNTKAHLELLKTVPNESVLDLSLIVYHFRNNDPDEEEVLVTHQMFAGWDVSFEEMICDALDNTRALMGEKVCPLQELVKEMAEKMHMEMEADLDAPMPMFVFTNFWKRNGAVCMLYLDTIQEMADMMNCDLFVVPSSVHEVILIPVGQGIERGQLDHMICEINRTELLPEDVLSDHTYLFSRKLGRVIL